MIHQRLRIYDERTGDPAVDNRNRRRNRLLPLHAAKQLPGADATRPAPEEDHHSRRIREYARVIAEIAEAMAASLALPTEPIVAVAERAKQRRPERRPIVTTMPL